MAERKQQINRLLLTAFFAFILSNCANQMSPPGGDVDEIPPVIIDTYPENNTINFTEKEIEFTFSEYVNKRNINEAFFVSPLIEGLPEFSWTNRTVYIEFPDTLRSNTTYSVIIGTEITDFNNNNNMAEPFILTFSTGAKIDSGKISGRVFGINAEGTLIFAYKDQTGWTDIYNEKPSYLSQINEKGYYEIAGLGIGQYRVFAVKDEFKDFIYDVGSDMIGLPFKDVFISDSILNVKGLYFQLIKEDTLAPNILNVTMTDLNHLVVEFDEPVDSSKISTGNFAVHDSTIQKNYTIDYWLQANSNKNEYILVMNDSLALDNDIYLLSQNITDRKGNISGAASYSFTPSDTPDTNSINLIKINTPFEGERIDYLSPSFSLMFNDGFDFNIASQAIRMYDPDSVYIPLKFDFISNGEIFVKPASNLKPKNKYTLKLNMRLLTDLAGNFEDTVLTKSIDTIDDLYFSGASGRVISIKANLKVVLEGLGRGSVKYQTIAGPEKKFSFERVIPGEYYIWSYVDKDSSNDYSYGNVKPFEFSEEFKYYSDTLELRSRWPVGDIIIDLNNNK